MRALSASRFFLAGLVAAFASAPMPASAESLEITHPGMLKAPAPSAAPVAPSGWDPVKKQKITGKPTAGAQAQTDVEFLRQRAARVGMGNSSTWIRVGQLPTSGPRKSDAIVKRGAPKPDRGQVAMETLVIQNEGTKAPKAPQAAALDDLPHAPSAPGAMAPAPRAPSQAFNPTELRVKKTVPWKRHRGRRAATTPKAFATK